MFALAAVRRRSRPQPFVREQPTPWSGDATFSVVGLHQFHQDSVAPKGSRRGGLHPPSAGPRAVRARGLAQQEGRPCLGTADPAEARQETRDCLAAAARAHAAESADPGFSVASLRPGGGGHAGTDVRGGRQAAVGRRIRAATAGYAVRLLVVPPWPAGRPSAPPAGTRKRATSSSAGRRTHGLPTCS